MLYLGPPVYLVINGDKYPHLSPKFWKTAQVKIIQKWWPSRFWNRSPLRRYPRSRQLLHNLVLWKHFRRNVSSTPWARSSGQGAHLHAEMAGDPRKRVGGVRVQTLSTSRADRSIEHIKNYPLNENNEFCRPARSWTSLRFLRSQREHIMRQSRSKYSA